MDPTSSFQQKMVEYLEGVHMGEFYSGKLHEVRMTVDESATSPGYKDPTLTLPEKPPPRCHRKKCNGCFRCPCNKTWQNRFKHTVDDLLLRSNVHTCGTHCVPNGQKSCKSRFPREGFTHTLVDPKTGALNMKKGEPQMNTFSAVLTYLIRSNFDVTSLLSGTAIKAVVAYVTEYVTKTGLKTYTIFDTIKSIFDKNSEMIGRDKSRQEKAHQIITKVVNALTTKMEIGGSMASLYLLGNPDHYTSHKFIIFYWKSYVAEVLNAWKDATDIVPEANKHSEKVVLNKQGQYVGLSTVHDYTLRPTLYENVTLYNWIQLAKKSLSQNVKEKILLMMMTMFIKWMNKILKQEVNCILNSLQQVVHKQIMVITLRQTYASYQLKWNQTLTT